MKSLSAGSAGPSGRRLYHFLYPGINARITGPFLVVIALVAAVGVFIVTRLVAGSLQERFNNQLVDSAAAANSAIADIEREQLATLRLMVFTEGVPRAMVAADANQLDLWLRPIAANARIDDMIIFDAAGQGILQLTRVSETSLEYQSPPPPNIAQWGSVHHVLDQNADPLGDKFVDVVGSPPNFYISAPVLDSGGQVVGGITIGMRMSRLAESVSAQSLSAVAFYNDEGTILGSTFRLATPGMLAMTPAHARELSDLARRASPIEEKTFSGVPYQLLYTPLHLRSQPIGLLAVGLPTNFIVDRISTSRDTFGLLFSVVFLVIGSVGLLTARSITHPIGQLVDTTRAIRSGDLSKRVGLNTPDELGELADSFDHMTAQLIERNAEIEALYLQQLRETAQRDAVLASIGDAVIVQAPNGAVILSNHAALQLLKSVESDPQARLEFDRVRRNADALKQARTIELAGCFFSVIATQVRLSSGILLGHVIVFHNITTLLEAERLKDTMIQQMSHELRTPLTVIHGSVDLVHTLERKNLSLQGQEFIQNAINNLRVLERMVDQVIDVSAIVSNRFNLNISSFNLAAVLDECVSKWENQAAERKLTLSLMLPSNEMWIEGDRRHLSQVFDHLIRNAYSYTLPGGNIEVFAAAINSHIKIYVTDNGVGIPPDELKRVFERMFRGSSSDIGPTDTRGLGLGLYLSRYIIEAHRGTISIDSKTNFGTVVIVELPIHQKNLR
jgi:two-component system sensor histidine kinase VicK